MYGDLPTIETTDGGSIRAYPIHIPSSPDGPKTAAIRLPTTAELLAFLASQRSIYQTIGRGGEDKPDVIPSKAIQTLFTALRLDKGTSSKLFDDAEAMKAINTITAVRADSCVPEGDQQYVVTLITVFGPCEHTVSIPFQIDQRAYRENFYVSRDLGHGKIERRFPPQVPCDLYDKVFVSAEGYSENLDTNDRSLLTTIPPHHKRAVVQELMTALSDLDPSLDPNS